MKKNLRLGLVFAVGLLTCALSSASAQTVTVTPDLALKAVFAQRSILPASSGRSGATLTCGLYCDTSINATTATISGSGPDCTTAQNSLTSQLQSIARADCLNNWTGFSYCVFSLHITSACTLIAPGTYQVQGYATYSCKDTTC